MVLPWLLALALFQTGPTGAEGAPRLERVAVVPTAGPGAEILSLQTSTRRAALTHSRSGRIEVFDLTDPALPRSLSLIDLALEKGEELTSVALPPKGDWCLAVVKAEGHLEPGMALIHSLSDGRRLASFPCGVGPDCVVISASGARALIANEAEGFDEVEGELVSAPGSLTLIELAEDPSRSRLTQIPFQLAAAGSTDARILERRIHGDRREVQLQNGPEFLEPEVVLFLPGEERALVTLQENNLVAVVDLSGAKIERLIPLGTTTHPADLLQDGRFDERGVLIARREPDGIALSPNGRTFLTADEGDTGPDPAETAAGLPCAGARTVSVFDLATGELLGDTGADLDRMAALADLYPDHRSQNKGSEPEMVVTFQLGETPLAAVTLERAGAVALVDLGDPPHPRVVAIARSGKDARKDEPEGLAHFCDPASGTHYLYVANEGTGTLGVLRVAR